MEKKLKSALSFLLASAMLASMSITSQAAAAAGTDTGTFPFSFTPVAEEVAAETPTVDETNLPAPVIVDFSSALKMSTTAIFADFEAELEGLYHFVTLEDGTGCLKLDHSAYGNWNRYRMMPALNAKGLMTEQHKYVRVTYMTNDVMANTITVTNNANGQSIVLVENTSASGGEFVRSNAVNIEANGILERYTKGMHCAIQYTSGSEVSDIYIKEIAFFASEKQAYDYYGDTETEAAIMYSAMSFGPGGTGTTTIGDTYGKYNTAADGALEIVYADSTNSTNVHYMAKVKYAQKADSDSSHKYVRVAYSAKQPETVTGAGMFMYNDANGNERVRLVENLVDTNGKYVLGDTVLLYPMMVNRFTATGNYTNTMHNSLITNVTVPDAAYTIKALYFFPTRESAESFTLPSNEHKITINGNDITKYQIVISDDAPVKVNEAATILVKRVHELTDYTLPIVNDKTPETAYEILIGPSDRVKSTAKNKEIESTPQANDTLWSYVDGDTVVITATLPYNTKVASEAFVKAFLYDGLTNIPETIDIGEKHNFILTDSTIKKVDTWSLFDNVANPVQFTEDFDIDDGYFAEESGASDWNYEGGVMTAKADDLALSYIHVFEPDVTYSAKLKYTAAGNDGDMGLMLRYNSALAWVKAGYDFAKGEWYLISREGHDFYEQPLGTAPMALTPDTWYELTFTVDGADAVLSVNGAEIIRTAAVKHLTPGRIAVYAEDATVSIDDVNVLLLSGEGIIWKDVAHTKLPYDSYIEGGSVYEMSDGSLVYQNHNSKTYKSTDNGTTWVEAERVFPISGYMNVLRLNDGSFMQIFVDGTSWKSRISKDDGKTWEVGGEICKTKYQDTLAGAGNMNDKLMQTASGKLFYGQNYEISNGTVDGRSVFCEFYYSDDLGKTWTKSETDSWEIEGNEEHTHFGEAKLLECADGTIRMYDSWNHYGCVVYSDSTDGGKTFGPLQKMEELECACSSMQFVRDVYADNDTTYYMVWVNSKPTALNSGMTRARLTLAKSTDGKNWTVLGDVWRWESGYTKGGAYVNHVVDPFIKTTEDYILVGSGFSEHTALEGEPTASKWHQAQRQHIYAIPKASIEPGEKLYNFTDVTTKDSYYDAVKYAVDEGLFNGTSETTFSPAATMTRSMFVTVLGRLDNADVSAYTTPTFSDVVAGQWYTSYVEWAAANGIVNGMGDGIYGINGEITVQQACLILARYANFADSATVATNTVGGDVPGAPKTSADYADAANVADWAKEGVDWAIANGVYAPNGNINPASAASRALVATMFANYVKAYNA